MILLPGIFYKMRFLLAFYQLLIQYNRLFFIDVRFLRRENFTFKFLNPNKHLQLQRWASSLKNYVFYSHNFPDSTHQTPNLAPPRFHSFLHFKLPSNSLSPVKAANVGGVGGGVKQLLEGRKGK